MGPRVKIAADVGYVVLRVKGVPASKYKLVHVTYGAFQRQICQKCDVIAPTIGRLFELRFSAEI